MEFKTKIIRILTIYACENIRLNAYVSLIEGKQYIVSEFRIEHNGVYGLKFTSIGHSENKDSFFEKFGDKIRIIDEEQIEGTFKDSEFKPSDIKTKIKKIIRDLALGGDSVDEGEKSLLELYDNRKKELFLTAKYWGYNEFINNACGLKQLAYSQFIECFETWYEKLEK